MSEFMEWGPNENGQYTFSASNLDPYWQRTDHMPYFILSDGELAGFVFVRKYPGDERVYDIEQFFVLRKFKGLGVGKEALQQVTDLHKGVWQIRVLKENQAALSFWKSALSGIVGDNFELTQEMDIDLEMHFLRFTIAA